MIVSHKHRFVFVKTRKTGGTSVQIALERVCGPDDIVTPLDPAEDGYTPRNWEETRLDSHDGVPALVAKWTVAGKDPEELRAYTIFTVERNPWAKCVSQYEWNRAQYGEPRGFRDWILTSASRHPKVGPYGPGMPVDAPMWLNDDGTGMVNMVIAFEDLANALGMVWRQLHLPGEPDLPWTKRVADSGVRDYRHYYQPDTQAVVEKHFSREIRSLGYEFDPTARPQEVPQGQNGQKQRPERPEPVKETVSA